MAVEPGGATSRRCRPQPEQGPRRRSAAVEQGSQTGPSGRVVAGGRASPQRAQTRSGAGGGLGHGRGGWVPIVAFPIW